MPILSRTLHPSKWASDQGELGTRCQRLVVRPARDLSFHDCQFGIETPILLTRKVRHQHGLVRIVGDSGLLAFLLLTNACHVITPMRLKINSPTNLTRRHMQRSRICSKALQRFSSTNESVNLYTSVNVIVQPSGCKAPIRGDKAKHAFCLAYVTPEVRERLSRTMCMYPTRQTLHQPAAVNCLSPSVQPVATACKAMSQTTPTLPTLRAASPCITPD